MSEIGSEGPRKTPSRTDLRAAFRRVGRLAASVALTEGRFRVAIALLIAAVSLLGAGVTFAASQAANEAAALDDIRVQETAETERIQTGISATVENDVRLLARYREHVLAWRQLSRAAESAYADDPAAADALMFEAQGRHALAQSIRQLFLLVPDYGDQEGVVKWDPARQLETLMGNDPDLHDLGLSDTERRAAFMRGQALQFVWLVFILVIALFLLTIAQLFTARIRAPAAIMGAALALLVGVTFLASPRDAIASGGAAEPTSAVSETAGFSAPAISPTLRPTPAETAPVPSGPASVFDLTLGSCWNTSDPETVADVELVRCDAGHQYEVYGVVQYDRDAGDTFPGDEAVTQLAEQECIALFEPFVGLDYDSSTFFIFTLRPSAETWADGDREVICSLYDPDNPELQGSMEGVAH